MAKKYNKRISKTLPSNWNIKSNRQKFIFTVISFAMIGMGTLYLTQAAGHQGSIEAENGNLFGNAAASFNDQTASSGGYVSFNVNSPGEPGLFTESFGTLTHWALAHWAVGNPATYSPNTSATIVNGRVLIANADQNYGEATLRSDRMYDLRNGGTVSFDVSLGDGALQATGAFIGFPYVAFADQPVNAPSYFDDNGQGTGPRNGGYYQFFHTCALPWQAGHARQFINYIETVMPGETTDCLGQVTVAEGQINRVELRYNGNNGWELWASNVNSTAPLVKLREFNMQIPEIGYLIIGSHNHASLKYSNDTRPTANATFDNISYPAAAGYTSSFRNGNNVVKGAATTAHVVFNGYANNTTGSYSVTVNGTAVSLSPVFHGSRSFPAAVEVPIAIVRDGANAITVQGFDTVFDLELVLTRTTP